MSIFISSLSAGVLFEGAFSLRVSLNRSCCSLSYLFNLEKLNCVLAYANTSAGTTPLLNHIEKKNHANKKTRNKLPF